MLSISRGKASNSKLLSAQCTCLCQRQMGLQCFVGVLFSFSSLPKASIRAFLIEIVYWLLLGLVAGPSSLCPAFLQASSCPLRPGERLCATKGDLCAVRRLWWGVSVPQCHLCIWGMLLGWELWLGAWEWCSGSPSGFTLSILAALSSGRMPQRSPVEDM